MIPFIDLKKQYSSIKPSIMKRIEAILDGGQYIMGKEVTELETALTSYTGTNHCISCSSGTDALVMVLMAWGIGSGDEVITSPFTFMASAEAISLVGAKPVFADISPETFNLSVTESERVIIQKTENDVTQVKAVIPVDIFGCPCDYAAFDSLSEKYNIKILEDAAQSFGGILEGKPLCSFGHAATTSFFPAKPLGGYGDGGAIFTNDDELAKILKSIRIHGQGIDRYENIRIGMNGRLDTIQAAILLEKLKIFSDELDRRELVAKRYQEGLGSRLQLQKIPYNARSAWAQFSLLADDHQHRERIQKKLLDQGIPTMIYYHTPLHLQEAYQELGYQRGDLPITERICDQVFSIPMHPYLDNETIDLIVKTILKT